MIITAEQIRAAILASGGEEEDQQSRRKPGRPPLYLACSFDWCPKKHFGNGYCRKHNWSLWRYGDPLATSRVGNPPTQADAHMWPYCVQTRWSRRSG